MDDFSFNLGNEEVLETGTAFVEKYADYVENLPFDLQRSATRLREIDCTCREILTDIETLYGNFTKEKDLNLARKSTAILIKIQCLFGRCQELGDEKIFIAQQISEYIEAKKKAVEQSCCRFKALYRPAQKNEYNGKRELNKMDSQKGSKRSRRQRPIYNDKHDKEKASSIDALEDEDAYLEQFFTNPTRHSHEKSSVTSFDSNSAAESKMRDESLSTRRSEKTEKKESSPASSTSSGNAAPASVSGQKTISTKPSATKTTMPSSRATINSTSSNGSSKSSTKRKAKVKKIFKPNEKSLARSPELPIDPDEPTYCLCEQVSFGQMIGCDNKKCPIEWFHFTCVGLTLKPKGKWYCPNCTREMKDRKKESKKDHR